VSDPTRCPECGVPTAGTGSVDGLCSSCLLRLGLGGAGEERATRLPESEKATPPVGSPLPGGRETLHPLGTGALAPLWAMPAELLRQAARRLALAAFGVGLVCAVSIIVNNLLAAVGWYNFSHMEIRNVIMGTLVAVSAATAWTARAGRLTPRDLLRVGLAFEVAVAFGISLHDHLEPLQEGVPLAAVSWLCIWIVMFPLVVPAPPRWALAAALAAASTWPLGYLAGLAVGNPPAPTRVLVTNFAENYFAAILAMFTTSMMRRLQELGCYQLVRKLDRGGMGEIWQARHRMLARPVAIKLIRPELLGVRTAQESATLISRFKREAEATAALHSPHTVALHDFGVTPEGVFYYVMELLEGLDLETLVKRFGAVPPERAIHLLGQACDSLADAHAAGLIHRDIKPANIVACHWGLKWDFVKVLDFGLVKAAWTLGEDERLTSDGVITGTPAFMAPEAALGGRPLDARVDLYGLGCVAYWLLTGERVFAGKTPMEVVLHHVKTPVVPPSERAREPIPESLEKLVLSCLAKEPEDRPPSAEWLGDRLAECRTDQRWSPQRAREWWEENVLGGPASYRHASTAGVPTVTSSTPVKPLATPRSWLGS
jgi:serine/threonine protein kinase